MNINIYLNEYIYIYICVFLLLISISWIYFIYIYIYICFLPAGQPRHSRCIQKHPCKPSNCSTSNRNATAGKNPSHRHCKTQSDVKAASIYLLVLPGWYIGLKSHHSPVARKAATATYHSAPSLQNIGEEGIPLQGSPGAACALPLQ